MRNDPLDDFVDEPDESELQELADQLPEDLDPHEMADTIEDELVAEEGEELGLDPDLAVFAARDELEEEGEEFLG
ncbi:MAG TPA: hypothetical protein VG276_05610 [Actinomycetes bacterium]|nr:hypothetical protein [Actinomycetes bacterium]